jgi:hypothetical protein
MTRDSSSVHHQSTQQQQQQQLSDVYLKILTALLKQHPEYKFDLPHLSLLLSHFQRFTHHSTGPEQQTLFKAYLTQLLQHTNTQHYNKPTHLHFSELLFGIRFFIRPPPPPAVGGGDSESIRAGEGEGNGDGDGDGEDPFVTLIGLYSKRFRKDAHRNDHKQVVRRQQRNQWGLMMKNLNAFYLAQFLLAPSSSSSSIPFGTHNNHSYFQQLHGLDTTTLLPTNIDPSTQHYHKVMHEIFLNCAFLPPVHKLKSSQQISNEPPPRATSSYGFVDYTFLSPTLINTITDAVWTHYMTHPHAIRVRRYESKIRQGPRRSKTGRYELCWNNYFDGEPSHVTIGYRHQRGFSREFQVNRPLISIEFLPPLVSSSPSSSPAPTSRLWSRSYATPQGRSASTAMAAAAASAPLWSLTEVTDSSRLLEDCSEEYLAMKYTALPVFRYKTRLVSQEEVEGEEGRGRAEEVEELIKQVIDEFYESLGVLLAGTSTRKRKKVSKPSSSKSHKGKSKKLK